MDGRSVVIAGTASISACGPGNSSSGDAAGAPAADAGTAADVAADGPVADGASTGGTPDADTSDGATDGPAACTKPNNHALRFSGAQGIDVARTAALEPSDFTIEAWVNFSVPF